MAAKRQLARGLSRLGHPAIVLPGTVVLKLYLMDMLVAEALFGVGIVCAICAAVMGYAVLQARRGVWADSDASDPLERRDLTLVLMGLLVCALVGAAAFDQPAPLVRGLAIGLGLVAMIKALSPVLKVSLHMTVAVLCAILLWPEGLFVVAGSILAMGVGWSRLELGRHTWTEVRVGAGLGGAVGLLIVALG